MTNDDCSDLFEFTVDIKMVAASLPDLVGHTVTPDGCMTCGGNSLVFNATSDPHTFALVCEDCRAVLGLCRPIEEASSALNKALHVS
jgi:hypothetical protein